MMVSELLSREQRQRRSLLGVVDVEEIGVQNSLNKTCNDRDGLKVTLSGIAIDPIGNI
jgi:hypothetical protein